MQFYKLNLETFKKYWSHLKTFIACNLETRAQRQQFVSTVPKYSHKKHTHDLWEIRITIIFFKGRFKNLKWTAMIINWEITYNAKETMVSLAVKVILKNTFCPLNIRKRHALIFIYSTNICWVFGWMSCQERYKYEIQYKSLTFQKWIVQFIFQNICMYTLHTHICMHICTHICMCMCTYIYHIHPSNNSLKTIKCEEIF